MYSKVDRQIFRDCTEIFSDPEYFRAMSAKNILITGATGFIGSYIAKSLFYLNTHNLLDRPACIYVAYRSASKLKDCYAPFLQFHWCKPIYLDLNNPKLDIADDINIIFHCASQATSQSYSKSPVNTILPNVIGTNYLLDMLKNSDNPQAFMFLSSSEVYGRYDSDIVLVEPSVGNLDHLSTRDSYGESKRMGESLCSAYYHEFSIPTYVARLFHSYGPGLSESDPRIFADFAFKVINRQDLVIHSNPATSRSFCYIADVCKALFAIMRYGQCNYPYNVANPDSTLSIEELAELLIGLYPQYNLSVKTDSSTDWAKPAKIIPSIIRMNHLLWFPSIEPAVGFKRLIESYPHK